MIKKTAGLISLIFHPLLLPTFAVALMFFLPSYLALYPIEYKKAIILVVFLSTFISPLLILLLLLNLRVISDLSLTDRKERILPLGISFLIYIASYFLSIKLPLSIPDNISNFILLSAFVILCVFLLNFKFKVSAHLAGLGGFLGFFHVFVLKEPVHEILFRLFDFQFTSLHFLSIIILLTGFTASSRLLLKAHSISEISVGFLTGLCIGLVNLFF
jgi:hypothetical protein